jgi:hypothetical protein
MFLCSQGVVDLPPSLSSSKEPWWNMMLKVFVADVVFGCARNARDDCAAEQI